MCGLIPAHAGKTAGPQVRSRPRWAHPLHAGKTWRTVARFSMTRVHPRSRGENSACKSFVLNVSGSSPLTRGKRRCDLDEAVPDGLIPAHTGKTRAQPQHRGAIRAHPRSRGENFQIGMPRSASWGSSPLTRGKLGDRPLADRESGLIPAHTGKTTNRGARTTGTRAHPRSRGENAERGAQILGYLGSSPLMRGKPDGRLSQNYQAGLIPAHAGKRMAEHPNTSRVGSSPLTRGKRKSVGSRRYQEGLIPAHAGKMEQRSPPRLIQRAHPRSREENRAEKAHPAFQKGSSPLTRGKRYRDVRGWLQGRLIPAHVGKTMTAPPVAIHRRAHPRSRGENTGWLSEGGHHYGSSPLTRGKLGVDALNTLDERRIPAHAGKP